MLCKDSMYTSQKIQYTFSREAKRRLLYIAIIIGDGYECTQIHSVKKQRFMH
jgi:hypothetical protein